MPPAGTSEAVIRLPVRPFINGNWEESRSSREISNHCPATDALLYSYPAGSPEDVDRAVAAARRAFEDGRWNEAAPSFRQKVLQRFADLVIAKAAELDLIDAREMGKPVSVGFCNAAMAGMLVRYCAEAFDKSTGDVFTSDQGSYVTQRRVPCGVVGAIASWNFPTFVALLKVAPALAAGNTMVLKPSELSPTSALELAKLAIEAGLPEGVLNVVPGTGAEVGEALCLHRDVDLISFTGSTPVGKKILQSAGASNMKRVLLECGGKSPHIVLDRSVDLDKIATAVAGSILRNQGQVCSAGTRVLVARSIEQELIEAIVTRFRDIRIGDPTDPATTFGPLASRQQLERVKSAVEEGVAGGAVLRCGGGGEFADRAGCFIGPTLFSGVAPDMRIAREEVFGPVLSVISFDEPEEAIRIANGTDFGLFATVWTRDMKTGLGVAKRIRSNVAINTGEFAGEGARFGASNEPARESGFGSEGGMAGIESYQRRQTISIFHG